MTDEGYFGFYYIHNTWWEKARLYLLAMLGDYTSLAPWEEAERTAIDF